MTIWSPQILETSGPKYLAIADAIGEAIADGSLTPGGKLPPQRHLAYDLGITLGTVTRAYQEAERRGLVAGEVGRGTFVRNRGMSPTPSSGGVLAFGEPRKSGVVDFTVAAPVIGPSGQYLAETLREIAGGNDLDRLVGYQPSTGIAEHLEAGSIWIEQRGLKAPGERIAITNGAQLGIMATLMAVARAGDLILCESLTYPGMTHIATQLGLNLDAVAIDEAGLIPDAFEAACRLRAPRALYCMPTLHNPTTATLSEERRRAIARIAEAYDVMLIEDDLWGRIMVDAPVPMSVYAPDRSFYITGLSKTLAPGLRIGYVLSPESHVEALRRAVRMTTWMTPPLMAEIARRWIIDGAGDRLIEWHRIDSARRTSLAAEHLKLGNLRLDPAAYHVWLELPEPWRASAFRQEAEARGVMFYTGDTFAVGRAPAPHAIRICTGAPESEDEMVRGLKILATILADPRATGPSIV